MPAVTEPPSAPTIEHNAPIPTWFGIGGRAARLARPRSVQELGVLLRDNPTARILGDGANLLVDDDGVDDLVIRLDAPAFTSWTFEPGNGPVRAGAGAILPKLILEAVRQGRAGLEGLGGIPATLGGAVIMNAGGAFGQIADAVARVRALKRDKPTSEIVIERDEIDFSYRHSGLSDLIITSVELDLPEEDAAALRKRLKEVMEYKKRSQPMADRSAGCVFKNPTLPRDIESIGHSGGAGERASAGMLIDRAGCKGLAVRGASVSDRHANFIVTDPKTAKARDVIDLMAEVQKRVMDAFGVQLEPEVVIWKKG